MVIAFFELRLIGLTRFPLWLTPELKRVAPNTEIVLFYEQDDIDDKASILSQYPKGTKLVKVASVNERSISELLLLNKVDKLVVMAQRVPDSCFVAIAKKIGVKTIMYQHGLYIPFMKREGTLFTKNMLKVFRFIQYAMTTANVTSFSFLRMMFAYYRVYILGVPPLKSGLPMSAINVDKVMIYGSHWKDYHSEQYGYEECNQIIVGTPDFNDLPSLLRQAKLSNFDICYIAQTLVEDGRLSRDIMELFIAKLARYLAKSSRKLFVRLHPRSDMSIYEPLVGLAEFSKSEFPQSQVYLGHYSSLIAKATFFSDKIILVDFPGHSIPEYIDMLKYSKVGFSDFDKMSSSIDAALNEGVVSKKLVENIDKQDHFFDSRIEKPLGSAAKCILSF